MKPGPRLISRIALFSALIYVLSWATSYLPNVNFIFFLVFSAGFLWGAVPGILVGMVGMWLWTSFNPYGPASLPVMAAQLVGAGSGGVVGAVFRRAYYQQTGALALGVKLATAAVVCTLAFYLPVNAVDAWLFQPFWPRFLTGLPWVAVSLVSNAVIFILFFKVTAYLYKRERSFR